MLIANPFLTLNSETTQKHYLHSILNYCFFNINGYFYNNKSKFSYKNLSLICEFIFSNPVFGGKKNIDGGKKVFQMIFDSSLKMDWRLWV